MANEPVARRYAQALFELGKDKDQLQELGEALQQAKSLFEQSDELRTVLVNPGIRLDERRAVIGAVADKMEWPKLFRNFVLLLLEKDRLQFIDAIAVAFSTRWDAHLGRARARVTSAVELGDADLQALKERLDKLTGKEVIMTTDVDEELIGGVVARVGSTIYDGSVRTHLQRMREAILQEV